MSRDGGSGPGRAPEFRSLASLSPPTAPTARDSARRRRPPSTGRPADPRPSGPAARPTAAGATSRRCRAAVNAPPRPATSGEDGSASGTPGRTRPVTARSERSTQSRARPRATRVDREAALASSDQTTADSASSLVSFGTAAAIVVAIVVARRVEAAAGREAGRIAPARRPVP